MKPHHLLWAAALACLLGRASALSLPSLFSLGLTRDADDKGVEDADEETLESLEMEEREPPHEPTKKPTRPPLLPAIPHPADHPLHPHNDPHHPLHPDNLPHLPALPPLPPLPPLPALPDLHHRETIHATKTVYVVATEKVTIHPVCMKVNKLTPPCLPYSPHPPALVPLQHHHYHHHGWKGEGEEGDEGEKETGEGTEAISPSKAAEAIQTSAVAELEDPVLLVEGESEPGPEEVEGAEGEREARYVELTPSLDAAPDQLEIKDEPQEAEPAPGGGGALSRPLGMVQELINHYRPAVTLYKTKTVYLTKVDKVVDARVTATLAPHNCVPVNSHIPVCGPAGTYGTGFQYKLGIGQQHGVYTEALGGHFLPGYGKDEEHPGAEVREEKEQATDSE